MGSKHQAYSEYKVSSVDWMGNVPKDWSVLPCRAAVKNIADKNEGAKDQNYLSLMANIGVIRYEDKGDIGNKKPDDLSKCKIVAKGNLVINSMNYAIGSYGMSSYDGVCSPVYIVLDADADVIEPRFSLRVFENRSFQKYLATFGNGILAHRAAIGWDDIKGAYIPLPSKEEQVAILNFLDHETAKIDTLIEKQQQLIKLLKEKRQAVISHAVTKGLNPNAPLRDSGVEWLGEVPEHWVVPKLIHRTSRIGDGLHSTPKYQNNTGLYFVNGNNLVNGRILVGATAKEVPECEYKSHYVHLDESSVLLSINGTIGNVARYSGEKIILGKSASYINCSGDLLPAYLMLYLQSGEALRYFDLEVTGTTIFNLSLNSIRQMKICVPPESEQIEIDEHCQFQKNKYDVLINKADTAITLMQERRTALISAAVTGKIDVRHFTLENKREGRND